MWGFVIFLRGACFACIETFWEIFKHCAKNERVYKFLGLEGSLQDDLGSANSHFQFVRLVAIILF